MKCVARTIPDDTRSKYIADCESLRSFRRSIATLTRENKRSLTKEAENDPEPKGTPSMQTSSVGTKTTPSFLSASGQSAVALAFSHDHSLGRVEVETEWRTLVLQDLPDL